LYLVPISSIYVCRKHLVDLDSSRKNTSLDWWTYLPNGLEVFFNGTLADLIKGAPEINEIFLGYSVDLVQNTCVMNGD